AGSLRAGARPPPGRPPRRGGRPEPAPGRGGVGRHRSVAPPRPAGRAAVPEGAVGRRQHAGGEHGPGRHAPPGVRGRRRGDPGLAAARGPRARLPGRRRHAVARHVTAGPPGRAAGGLTAAPTASVVRRAGWPGLPAASARCRREATLGSTGIPTSPMSHWPPDATPSRRRPLPRAAGDGGEVRARRGTVLAGCLGVLLLALGGGPIRSVVAA